MTNACEHANIIFDNSMHALNVSFHIMREILFRYLIRVDCLLYMALDPILQVRNVLIYPAVIVSNKICTIRKDLTAFAKLGMYEE